MAKVFNVDFSIGWRRMVFRVDENRKTLESQSDYEPKFKKNWHELSKTQARNILFWLLKEKYVSWNTPLSVEPWELTRYPMDSFYGKSFDFMAAWCLFIIADCNGHEGYHRIYEIEKGDSLADLDKKFRYNDEEVLPDIKEKNPDRTLPKYPKGTVLNRLLRKLPGILASRDAKVEAVYSVYNLVWWETDDNKKDPKNSPQVRVYFKDLPGDLKEALMKYKPDPYKDEDSGEMEEVEEFHLKINKMNSRGEENTYLIDVSMRYKNMTIQRESN